MGLVPSPHDAVDAARARALARRLWELSAAGRQRGPLEIWHVVGTAGEPAFKAPWYQGFGIGTPVSFLKDHAGYVHLRGECWSNSTTSAGYIFYLPPNYRPDQPGAYGAWCLSRTDNRKYVQVNIQTDGGIWHPNRDYSAIHLSGIHFRAAG